MDIAIRVIRGACLRLAFRFAAAALSRWTFRCRLLFLLRRLLSWLRLWLRFRSFNWPADAFSLWLHRSRRPFNLRSLLHRPRYTLGLRAWLHGSNDLWLRSRSFNSHRRSTCNRPSTFGRTSAFSGSCHLNGPSTFSRSSCNYGPSSRHRAPSLSRTSALSGSSSLNGSSTFSRWSTRHRAAGLSRSSTFSGCSTRWSSRDLRRATSRPFVSHLELLILHAIRNGFSSHRSCEVSPKWWRDWRGACDHRRVLKFARDSRRDCDLAAAPR